MPKPSFDMTVQPLPGLMSRLGEPGQPPIYLGMGSGDAMGGLLTALGITLALLAREGTGRGQLIDASLYGAQLFLAAPSLQGYLATGSDWFSRQRSRRAAPNPLWNVFPAKDRWLFLCLPNDDAGWTRLCRALEDPALATDQRFDSPDQRRRNREALTDALDGILSQRAAADWLERFRTQDIVAGPLPNFSDLAPGPP